MLRLRREKLRRRDLTGELVGDGGKVLSSELDELLVDEERRLVSRSTSSSDTLAAGNDGAAASSRSSINFDDVMMECCVWVVICDEAVNDTETVFSVYCQLCDDFEVVCLGNRLLFKNRKKLSCTRRGGADQT